MYLSAMTVTFFSYGWSRWPEADDADAGASP
jgi:hypothetical protein